MHGTRGAPVALFDYDVNLCSRNNQSIVRLTVAAFDVAATPLPVFEAQRGRHDRFTQLLDKALRETGIDFSDDPEFSRVFRVMGDDAHAVRRVLNPDARAVLLRRSE